MHSGHIKWEQIADHGWVDTRQGGTWVYAYFTAYQHRSPFGDGIHIVHPPGHPRHPDPFVLHDLTVATIGAFAAPHTMASPNAEAVYTHQGTSNPLLAAVCLGSTTATFARDHRREYWWCAPDDITFKGRRILKGLADLYLRDPVIVTYVHAQPISPAVPETPVGTATAGAGLGVPQ